MGQFFAGAFAGGLIMFIFMCIALYAGGDDDET